MDGFDSHLSKTFLCYKGKFKNTRKDKSQR
jgi:hypothetical protein